MYICTNHKNAKCPVRSARGEAHRSWQPRSVRISKILLLRGSPSNNPILLTDPELLLRLLPIWYEITKLWNRQTHENKDGYFQISTNHSLSLTIQIEGHEEFPISELKLDNIWNSNGTISRRSRDTSNIIKENNLFEKHVNLDNLIL